MILSLTSGSLGNRCLDEIRTGWLDDGFEMVNLVFDGFIRNISVPPDDDESWLGDDLDAALGLIISPSGEGLIAVTSGRGKFASTTRPFIGWAYR